MSDANDTPQAPEPEAPNGRGGRDRLAAIIRDPGTVFLNWELNGARSAEAVRALGDDCRWCLRVLNLSDGSSISIPVDPEARNHYLEVIPGTTYGFELSATDGVRWRSVCRTERVEMPAAEPAGRDLHRGPEAAHAPARGFDRTPRGPSREVAGLRFETTAVRLGSSPHGRPPAEAERGGGKKRDSR